jgi:VanZ family protein
MENVRKKKTKTVILVGLVVCLMGFIFTMSHMPGNESAKLSNFFVRILEKIVTPFGQMQGDEHEGALIVLGFLVRKAAHFTEYAILGGLAFYTYCHLFRRSWHSFPIAVVFGGLYALSDEIHQHFVPGRVMALEDVLIDTCGVITGALFVALFARAHAKKTPAHATK